MIGANSASTHASLVGVTLSIGLGALALLLILEGNIRLNRSFARPIPPSNEENRPRFIMAFSHANSVYAYGKWIKWMRVLLGAVGIVCLIVAGVGALA
jgi:hypothetical protein